MYDEIGKKIKMLAKVSFIIMAIAISILGIVFAIIFGGSSGFLCILAAIVGVFLAWISGFILYGFGELVDKVLDIDKKLNVDKTKVASNSANVVKNLKSEKDEKREYFKKLFDQGLITEEEYNTEISKI